MKRYFLLLTVCLLGVASAIKAQAPVKELVDKVIARVGDEYILLSDVEEQYSATKDSRGSVPENFKCLALDQILVGKLLVNQAKIDSLYPKDEEIDQQLNARVDKILDYMGGNVEQFIAYYNITPDVMKSQMRDDMRDQIMGDKMRGKILEGTTVTPAEVKTFFSFIPKDSLPYFNQEVELAEIVRKPKPNEAQKSIARERLEKIRDDIVNGKKDFAELAKKNSQDPGSGKEGGDLGWAKRGKFVPEFEAQAFKLDEGQISPVFETEFGFHLLQLIERRGNAIHARHILIRPELVDEDYVRAKMVLDSVRREILKDSMTFSYAVKQFGEKNSQSYHNDGRLANPATGTNNFETRELDPDTYFAIDSMKVGSISAPIEVTSPNGEKYYRCVKLISKTIPHRASLATDYNKIQAAALEQKKNKALVTWIESKNQATFVNIDKMYDNCMNLNKWRKIEKDKRKRITGK